MVVQDRHLGSFALHEEFIIEVPGGDESHVRWRSVSLLELKGVIGKDAQLSGSDFKCRLHPDSSPAHDRDGSSHRNLERIPVEGDASHVDRLHAALMQAQIRYRIVGGLDSSGRCWGHLTLVVGSLLRAGMCLRRAGFFESPESKYVVTDSRTGWKVRILEDRPSRSS